MTSAVKIRCLIVDDEPLAREKLRGMLKKHPEIEIIGECANGKEAVATIQKENPDPLFLDIQMPEMDGFGVSKLFLKHYLALFLSLLTTNTRCGHLKSTRLITC